MDPNQTHVYLNGDVLPAVEAIVRATDETWVLESQPVVPTVQSWIAEWAKPPVPLGGTVFPKMQNDMERESGAGNLRRSFIMTELIEDPIELVLASLVWGWGNLGRFGKGAESARKALADGDRVAHSIEEITTAFKVGGTEEAYRRWFEPDVILPGMGVAFVTKILHFLGYAMSGLAGPKPLIYDLNVSTALARIASAPIVAKPDDASTSQYVAYCSWAREFGQSFDLEKGPVVVEYALFRVGGNMKSNRRLDY